MKSKQRTAWLVVAAINADNDALLFSFYYRTKKDATQVYDLLEKFIEEETSYTLGDIEVHKVFVDSHQIIEVKDTSMWGSFIFASDKTEDEDE